MGANVILIPHKRDITSITFKSDSTQIVGADSSGAIRQWKIKGGVGVEVSPSTMRMGKTVYAVAASADGRWIVCGGAEHKVVVWNTVTHQKAIEVAEHTSSVYAVDVSSDSKRFASGSQDFTVQIFDIITGARLISPLQHAVQVIGVKFSHNGSQIATATASHSVGVYDAYSGNKLFKIPVSTTSAPTTPLAWSSDNRELFVASMGKITCIDTSTSAYSEWSIQNSKSPQVSIVTSGRLIAYSAGSSVSLWDSTSYKPITHFNHTNLVTCLAISHDGKFLACGRASGITLYNLEETLLKHYADLPVVSRLPLMQISDRALNLWMRGKFSEAIIALSDEMEQDSNPSHNAYAARALVQAHLGEWKAAMEDAEKSLQVIQSPIGQIAKFVAHIGQGEQEIALDDLDFVFRNCDPSDIMLLLVINSIIMFVCDKHKQAISRLRSLIPAADEKMKDYYLQILGNMYLKRGDYKDAMEILGLAKNLFTPDERSPLTTISIVFNWDFEGLEFISWQRRCEALYIAESLKEVSDCLQNISDKLAEDDREPLHGQILEEIITRSGEVKLLAWTGKSSSCNSCLPSSPAVYGQTTPVFPTSLKNTSCKSGTAELREIIPLTERFDGLWLGDALAASTIRSFPPSPPMHRISRERP
ncbi:WD40-repeat-containing domain protein [Chiua virens]|nr:WD40-repeat-containing domain protein [Chiua virens]